MSQDRAGPIPGTSTGSFLPPSQKANEAFNPKTSLINLTINQIYFLQLQSSEVGINSLILLAPGWAGQGAGSSFGEPQESGLGQPQFPEFRFWAVSALRIQVLVSPRFP